MHLLKPSSASSASSLSAVLVACALAATLTTTQAHAQAPALEQSLAVIDFSLDRPFIKTSAYCGGVAEKLKSVGKSFALLSRGDTLMQLQGKMGGSSKTVPEDDLKARRAELKGLEDLIYEKPKKAIRPLEKLIDKLTALGGKYAISTKFRALYFDTYMSLARANNDSGNSKGLKKALTKLIRFVGDAKVTDDKYHPALVEMWGKVKKATAKERTSTLKVQAKPSGAEVLINGQPVGDKAPVMLKWFPGMVYVQARANGQTSKARKILLGKDRTTTVSIDLEYESGIDLDGESAGVTFASRAVFKERGAEFAQRLGKLLEVDKVALCGLTEKGGKVFIEGHLVDVESGNIDRGTALVTKANVISKNRVNGIATYLATGKLVQVKEDDGAGTIWYENPVGWSLIGLGVVGLGVGVPFFLSYQDKLDQALCQGAYTEASGNCNADYNQRVIIAEEAELDRGIAYAGFIVGGLALIGGVVAMVVMQPSGDGGDDTAQGPTLKSIGPWGGDNTAGAGFSMSF